MLQSRSNLRGIALMVLATGCFVANDTFVKLAMNEGIPPFEGLFLRALMAVLVGIPMLAALGVLPAAPLMLKPRVLLRNVFEFVAAVGYIFAIANAPLADVVALGQLAPMVMMLGAVVFFGDRIGRVGVLLIVVAFIGAVLVAQPGGSGFQPFALFGIWSAVASAARDLFGRRIPAEVPAPVVAVGASAVSLVGIGILMLMFEGWVMPDPMALLYVVASGTLLNLGQLFLFMSFRTAATGTVLPFLYTGTVWALVSGALVFGSIPNPLALWGIALILGSGVLVVVVDQRARRIEAAALPGR